MTDSHCPHCPRRGGPCRGRSAPRLCQLVDPSRRDYNPSYVRALDPDWPSGRAAPLAETAPSVDPSEAARLTRLVRACPYRSPPSCGCTGAARCALRGDDVQTVECWDCARRHPL